MVPELAKKKGCRGKQPFWQNATGTSGDGDGAGSTELTFTWHIRFPSKSYSPFHTLRHRGHRRCIYWPHGHHSAGCLKERSEGSFVGLMTLLREVAMNREQEYRQLANSVFQRASEEQSILLKAQWEILGARYLELADQSKKIGENDTVYDPIPWDRLRDTC